MFVIAEKTDVGGRDTVYRHLLATNDVYGGKFLPAFNKKEDAVLYLKSRDDNYRRFEIIELLAT